jgi:hypothetical protein
MRVVMRSFLPAPPRKQRRRRYQAEGELGDRAEWRWYGMALFPAARLQRHTMWLGLSITAAHTVTTTPAAVVLLYGGTACLFDGCSTTA